jgi:hypothetical protein
VSSSAVAAAHVDDGPSGRIADRGCHLGDEIDMGSLVVVEWSSQTGVVSVYRRGEIALVDAPLHSFML